MKYIARDEESLPGSARVSRVWRLRPRHRGLFCKDCFGETPKPTRETRALPRLIARERTWLASAPSLDVSSPSRTDCAFHLSFNPRKQRHWFSHHMSIRQLPPLRIRE